MSNRGFKMIAVVSIAVFVCGAGLSRAGAPAQALIAADNAKQHRPDPKEARRLYDAGATFVDVRTDREWSGGYVKRAIHIPLKDVAADAAAKLPDRNLPIVTYCAAGPRAAKGAAILRKLGYHNVTAMTGGYSDWNAAGGPVEMPR
ncbi:MAG TPA: rhodanese-like domain-containing protein [Candidatus Binataceae bacterium]|nr:rhodanese-like domain-containing protein [Candidatus Binataceae bacterium]